MAIQTFVLSKHISGLSADSVELDIRQMTENGEFVIENPKDLIASTMYRSMASVIDSRYTEQHIRSLFDADGKYRINVSGSIIGQVARCVIVGVDNKRGMYWSSVEGDVISRWIYIVQQITEDNVVYLVTDHVIAPEPGIDLVERCYHPYFTNIFDARRYLYDQNKEYRNYKGTRESGFRISVADVRKLEKSAWYKANLKIVEEIKKYGLDEEDFRYIKDVNVVLDSIVADAYDDLPLAKKAELNLQIIDNLRPYVPVEHMKSVDEQLAYDTHEDIIADADYVMTLALANADTKEKFDAIYAVLGPNSYRIGNLTDEIYCAKPNIGYIVVAKDGYMNWYASCYAINEWSGSESSEYHGVFQPNENDTLLSFREFHPEKHPEHLPSDKEVEDWDKKYCEFKYKQRQIHDELRFEPVGDKDGNIYVCGEWFCGGLESDESHEIKFFRKYGSHTFTQDEIIKLLNGEEIVIENFITKMEMEVTIKGKLQDVTDYDDDDMQVQFMRTDIDPGARSAINRSMGIEA